MSNNLTDEQRRLIRELFRLSLIGREAEILIQVARYSGGIDERAIGYSLKDVIMKGARFDESYADRFEEIRKLFPDDFILIAGDIV